MHISFHMLATVQITHNLNGTRVSYVCDTYIVHVARVVL